MTKEIKGILWKINGKVKPMHSTSRRAQKRRTFFSVRFPITKNNIYVRLLSTDNLESGHFEPNPVYTISNKNILKNNDANSFQAMY